MVDFRREFEVKPSLFSVLQVHISSSAVKKISIQRFVLDKEEARKMSSPTTTAFLSSIVDRQKSVAASAASSGPAAMWRACAAGAAALALAADLYNSWLDNDRFDCDIADNYIMSCGVIKIYSLFTNTGQI